MYLQRIELQGFKSFAQKTVLEFPEPGKGCAVSPNLPHRAGQLPKGICGTTAIVGPNGSGKSNVVDAVRWVLGEQSLKLLRGKKSTDVIFSGSIGKPRGGMAEVSLFLNNEDGSAPIDYSEVVITRKIYQDGNSEYLLNKSEVRLFDIVMLLARANFGQNTYSIIGQGMVDRIVNYSPQERKEFFDEATGVKQFQIKRDRSVAKLKKSRENLVQAESLLVELKPHLNSLTRQVNRLRRRQEVESELKEVLERYYGRLWLDLDAGYQKFAASFAQKEKTKIKLEVEISQLEKDLEELSQESSRGEEFNRLQEEYERKTGSVNLLSRRLAEVKGKLDVEYLKIGKQDLTWLENRRSELELKIKEIKTEAENAERHAERQKEILSDKEKEREKIESEFKEIESRLLRLQEEFKSGLGVSDKEVRAAINRIYSLQKDFIQKLKVTHDLESLAKLKVEAEVIFSEVESFYSTVASEEARAETGEMAELQKKLSDFIKIKDEIVGEINNLKIKLEVALSNQRSSLAKIDELQKELIVANSDLKKNQLLPKDQSEANKSLTKEKEELEKEIKAVESEVLETKKVIDEFNETEEKKKKQIFSTQNQIHRRQMEFNQSVSELNEIKVELARIETKKEDLFSSMRQDLGADFRPKVDHGLKNVDLAESEAKIIKLKKQLELIGGTDPEVEKEYGEVKERYDFLERESDDLSKAIHDLEKIVVELDKMIKNQFEREFKKINADFSRYFKKLFEGGSAKLILSQKELTEAEVAREELAEKDGAVTAVSFPPPYEGGGQEGVKGEDIQEKKTLHIEDKSYLANMGIDIEACPPGKKIKNISMLSGGEKTMTSLALVCAIIANNPSPFILFDEVDAALDESNSAKFSDIISELAHKTQFIVITHNRAIMARADVLYGVTMQGDGVSRLIGLKLDEAEKIYPVK
ncbi:MAG: AAA family ATPase [Patescibacteria group bacterium]